MRIHLIVTLAALATAAHAEPPAPQPTSQPTSQPASQPATQLTGHGLAYGFKHSFDNPEEWAKRFDAPDRDAWQKPDAVIEKLKLAPTAKVADIGAGTGYFTMRFARALPQGAIYGVDIEKKMVSYLTARATKAGLSNVKGVVATPEGAALPEPVDLIFICNTWHHIGGRPAWLKRAAAQLRPGGRIAIVDYTPTWEGHGPPKHARLSADAVIAEFKSAGFEVTERVEGLLPRQYLLVFGGVR